MKSKAAVLREFGKPLSIEELEVEPPKDHEVLVKNAYSGFCHSDLSVIKGDIKEIYKIHYRKKRNFNVTRPVVHQMVQQYPRMNGNNCGVTSAVATCI